MKFTYLLLSIQLLVPLPARAAKKEQSFKLYEPSEFKGMPYRLMKPIDFDPQKTYPLILSLHGKGGTGSDNRRSLRHWTGILADKEMRRKYPCFVLVPQSPESWRVNGTVGMPTPQDIDALPATWKKKYIKQLRKLKPTNNGSLSLTFELIEQLKRTYKFDESRFYVLGHSLGGFGSWNAIWHRPDYFAAAIPCAGILGPWQNYTKFKDVPVWAFHSADDRIVSVEHTRAIFKVLKETGGNLKYTEFDGFGHNAEMHAFTYQGKVTNPLALSPNTPVNNVIKLRTSGRGSLIREDVPNKTLQITTSS